MHTGERAQAQELARHNIDAFGPLELDAIIINAAGCGSTLKEYGHLLADDPAYAERARDFTNRVKDVNEFLAAIDLLPPSRPVNMTITYQDAVSPGARPGDPQSTARAVAAHSRA